MSLVLSVLVQLVAAAAFGLLQLQPPLLQHLIPPMGGINIKNARKFMKNIFF
jgi:hypothetical protein